MPKKGGKKPDWGVRPTVGPKPNEDVCISEEVKIGVNLAVERFRMNEAQKGKFYFGTICNRYIYDQYILVGLAKLLIYIYNIILYNIYNWLTF